MADDRNFRLKVITPERVFYEGDVHMVEFNTTEGEIGIYKGHVPMTVIVSPGILTISENSQTKNAALHAGFVEILQDKVDRCLRRLSNGRQRLTKSVPRLQKPVRRKGCAPRRRKRIYCVRKQLFKGRLPVLAYCRNMTLSGYFCI